MLSAAVFALAACGPGGGGGGGGGGASGAPRITGPLTTGEPGSSLPGSSPDSGDHGGMESPDDGGSDAEASDSL